jgi:DNA-binding NarL/FixJ family response regulator
MNEIRILSVDDHSLFRQSLSRLLETTPYIRVVAQCTTIAEALAAFSNLAPNLVLLDYDLGEEQGSALLVEIRNRQYDAKVLMVTAGMSQVAAVSALDAGALGIFLKHSSHEQLLSAIHRIAAGETWIDPLALRTLVSGRQPSAKNREGARALTIRQKEVMRGILDGFTNKEIGLSLKMSESSIKAAIQELFQKAGVRTRSQLVRIVIEKHSADWLKLDVEG